VKEILEEYAQYIEEINLSMNLNKSAHHFIAWFTLYVKEFDFRSIPLDNFIGLKQSDFPKDSKEVLELYASELQ
jgi:hypothetical protein